MNPREVVTPDEFGCILGHVAESGDDHIAVTKADLEGDGNAAPQVPTGC